MSDIEDRVTIKDMGGTFQSVFLDGKQVEPGKVEPGRATAMRAACIAGLKKGLQDGREEAQQPQQEECYRCGHPIPDGGCDHWPKWYVHTRPDEYNCVAQVGARDVVYWNKDGYCSRFLKHTERGVNFAFRRIDDKTARQIVGELPREVEPQPPSGEWAVKELKAGRMVRPYEYHSIFDDTSPYRLKDYRLQSWFEGKKCWVDSQGGLTDVSECNIWQPAEDPQPEPETVDNKIYPTDGYDEVYVPSRESRVSCVHATEHNSCLGYVVEGLEDLPDDQLPQMPIVWVYVGRRPGDQPPYFYHPPASTDLYKRRRAHAMRFKVEGNDES